MSSRCVAAARKGALLLPLVADGSVPIRAVAIIRSRGGAAEFVRLTPAGWRPWRTAINSTPLSVARTLVRLQDPSSRTSERSAAAMGRVMLGRSGGSDSGPKVRPFCFDALPPPWRACPSGPLADLLAACAAPECPLCFGALRHEGGPDAAALDCCDGAVCGRCAAAHFRGRADCPLCEGPVPPRHRARFLDDTFVGLAAKARAAALVQGDCAACGAVLPAADPFGVVRCVRCVASQCAGCGAARASPFFSQCRPCRMHASATTPDAPHPVYRDPSGRFALTGQLTLPMVEAFLLRLVPDDPRGVYEDWFQTCPGCGVAMEHAGMCHALKCNACALEVCDFCGTADSHLDGSHFDENGLAGCPRYRSDPFVRKQCPEWRCAEQSCFDLEGGICDAAHHVEGRKQLSWARRRWTAWTLWHTLPPPLFQAVARDPKWRWRLSGHSTPEAAGLARAAAAQ